MTQQPPPPSTPTPQLLPTENTMRLRGLDPAIEVSASNVCFLLGETAPGGVASMALRQGATIASSSPFFYVAQTGDRRIELATGASGTKICGTDLASSSFPTTAAAALVEPYVSLRTYSDSEQARVSGAGMWCRSLNALSYANLVGDYVTPNSFVPPTASALASAYIDLSNQIVKATVQTPGGDPAGNSVDFGGLLDTYESSSILNAPTANALRGAFRSMSNLLAVRLGAMSNQIVRMVQVAAGNVLGNLTDGIVSAAIAAASNGGSNIAGSSQPYYASSSCCSYSDGDDCGGDGNDSRDSRDSRVIVVYVNRDTSNIATGIGTGSGVGLGSGNGFQLVNDAYIYTPDGEGRFFFETAGATILAAAGNTGFASDQLAFAWYVNDMMQNVMELSGSGALWVRRTLAVGSDATIAGGLAVTGRTTLDGATTLLHDLAVNGSARVLGGAVVGGALTASGSATVAGPTTLAGTATVRGDATFLGDVTLLGDTLTLGSDVAISYRGSNIGINLPRGTDPVCALHVNGSVFSEEGLFELSDASVKTDIEPLKDALDKMLRIRGCSYQRTDIPLRQIGVIAQNVNQVVPEAVHVGSDGRMSVAYGNLVALAIEAIREVSENQRALVDRIALLERSAAGSSSICSSSNAIVDAVV